MPALPPSRVVGAGGAGLLAAALALPMVGPAQADSAPDRGQVSLKYLDYLDSQPGAKRIRVRAPSALVLAPLSGDWLLSGTLTSDVISGASPAYHTTALTRLRDERRAGEAEVTRYFGQGSVSLGANYSTEADYVSRGLAAKASVSSDDKNTTWSAGLGLNRDAINPSNRIVKDEHKQVAAGLLGVTQVLGTHDIVQLNLGYSRGTGYFSDPYKIFDERPRRREQTTVLARWNHHIDALQGTLRLGWRYYSDNWRVRSHTISAEYVQELPQGWTLTPLLRLYTQSAARFYVDADVSGSPFPPNPPPGAVHFSEDQRLSAYGARTVGLKLAKQFNADWSADIKVERYGQRGDWRLAGTGSPGLADFRARSVLVGLTRQF